MLLTCFLLSEVVSAQSQLPAPSRTIYKCRVNGTVSYSDEPCVGAQRIDAAPARGVDHLSGSRRVGTDVANEIHAEQFADIFRPLTGMSASQFATAVRRSKLQPAVGQECGQLEPAILRLEAAEGHADATVVKAIQLDLYGLRKRYKTLGC